MPLYDYQCPDCGHIEENVLISSFSKEGEEKPKYCQKCEADRDMIRAMSPPSLQFKGTGFYCTDYKD
jgi:putative FmdB family regulatory protein